MACGFPMWSRGDEQAKGESVAVPPAARLYWVPGAAGQGSQTLAADGLDRRHRRKVPEGLRPAPRAAPTGVAPPMGRRQSNSSAPASPSRARFPARTCHRKGCGRTFCPRSWNQRYCREPQCLRLLHRWQAAKRQRKRRRQAEKRQQHADAERARRRRQRGASKNGHGMAPSGPSAAAARKSPRAWSRSQRIPPDFCDRPGCYDPLPGPRRGPAQYCGTACARSQRRVRDRERKFKARQRKAAQCQARTKGQAARSTASITSRTTPAGQWRRSPASSERSAARVRTSPTPADGALSSRDRTELPVLSEEVSLHDPKTSSGP
jgi:hypothetical protein